MSAILVKMPPAIRSAAARATHQWRTYKARTCIVAGMKRRMSSIIKSSTLMSIMPMLIPASTVCVDRIRVPAQAGEGGTRVREGVHADTEPRDAVAAGDAHKTECENDGSDRD